MTHASPQLHNRMKTPPSRDDDVRRLRNIRDRHETAVEINFAFSGGPTLEWREPMSGDHQIMATFEIDVPAQQIEQLARYRDDGGFLLSLVDRAAARFRDLSANAADRQPGDFSPAPSGGQRDARCGREDKPKDHAAQAALLCKKQAYRRYLQEQHGLAANADLETVQDVQRKAIKVKSKSELNAVARWIRHHDAFKAWLNQSEAR